jgi:hypothetical protein
MLIQARFADSIASGAVTLTFRRWKRAQVVAGNTYRTAAGRIVVEAVDVVDPDRISDADAGRAGFSSCVELRAERLDGLPGSSERATYRIRFRPADGPDPRALLAANVAFSDDDLTELQLRLGCLDRVSSHGSWTAAVLQTIAERPGVRGRSRRELRSRDASLQGRRPQAEEPRAHLESRDRLPLVTAR